MIPGRVIISRNLVLNSTVDQARSEKLTHLRDPVAAPPRLEPVALPLHLYVGALALHRERGAQVVECHQEVQPRFGLKKKRDAGKNSNFCFPLHFLPECSNCS